MKPIQIVATIGPGCKDAETIAHMIDAGMSLARLNFSWGTHQEHALFVEEVRSAAIARGIVVPIIQDLSGPRVQEKEGHTFDPHASVITSKDIVDLVFTHEVKPEYVALSFVRTADDVAELRELLIAQGSNTRIIAKIERPEALEHLEAIITASDGIMIARGDLGEAIAFEKVPFVKKEILEKCIQLGKPAIVATEMLTSMIDDSDPSRADVTDISQAVVDGCSATMLSNETATGSFPVASVAVMRTVVDEALLHTQVPSPYRFE